MLSAIYSAAVKATEVIFGIVRLSAPALLASDPIVVGQNDPVWRGITKSYFLESYGNTQAGLNAAITAIGSSTPSVLYVTSQISVTSATTIPADIQVVFDGSGSFTVATGIVLTLTIRSVDYQRQVFFGLGTSRVRNSARYLSWWTGPSGTGSDDNRAFAQVLASLTLKPGGQVFIGAGTFYADLFVLTQTESTTEWIGSGAPIDGAGAYGTTIKTSNAAGSNSVFKLYQGVSQMRFSGICFDVGTSTTAQCFLVDGVQGLSSALNVTWDQCVFRSIGAVATSYTNCTAPAVDILSEGVNTDWEVTGLRFLDCHWTLGTNVVGLRSNTVNNSIDLDHPIFFGQAGAVGWLSNDSGWCTVKNHDTRGSSINYTVGVGETVHRTQTAVNVTFGTDAAIAPADVSVANDTIFVDAYQPRVGDRFQISTTGTLPAPLVAATNYYVRTVVVSGAGWLITVTTIPYATGYLVVAGNIDITSTGAGTHTITTNGTRYVTVTAGTNPRFTMDDLGQRITRAGLDSYVTEVLSDVAVMMFAVATTAVGSGTAVVNRQHSGTGLMYAGFIFAGNRGTTTFRGGVDEGVLYSMIFKATTAEAFNSVSLDSVQFQGRCLFEGQVIYSHRSCVYYSNSFTQIGGLGPVICDGGGNVILHQSMYQDTGEGTGNRALPNGYLYADNTHSFQKTLQTWVEESDVFNDRVRPEVPSLSVYDLTPSGDADNTVIGLQSGTTLTQAGAVDKILLWLGKINSVTKLRDFGYGFTRSGTTGFLNIIGDQSDPTFKGIDIADQIIGRKRIVSTAPLEGIGYATGAGGAVTQTVSKFQAVNLNTLSGSITLNNQALAASSTATFTFGNTPVVATDVMILNHISGGTAGAYTLNAQCISNGAYINVRNVSLGSLSEAIVIQYVVIRGVVA